MASVTIIRYDSQSRQPAPVQTLNISTPDRDVRPFFMHWEAGEPYRLKVNVFLIYTIRAVE